MYAGRIRPGVVAALVSHLPAGTALGRELGGPAAVSSEWAAIAHLDLDLRYLAHGLGGGKGDEPKLWEYPEGTKDRKAREAREAEAKSRWHQRVAEREARHAAGQRMKLRDL